MSAELAAMADEKIQYWTDFRNRRITAERERIATLRSKADRYSESYLEDLIESCEVSIRHSDRALTDLNAEIERRQAQ